MTRLTNYLKEDIKSILKFHDKVKKGSDWENKNLNRNAMIKALYSLRELRSRVAEYYTDEAQGYTKQKMTEKIRSADQLIKFAQTSIKENDPANFSQQFDRALMNLHDAIRIAS